VALAASERRSHKMEITGVHPELPRVIRVECYVLTQDAFSLVMAMADRFAANGMALQLPKTQVLLGTAATDEERSAVCQRLQEDMGIASPESAVREGLIITGVPIGSDHFIKAALDNGVAGISRCLGLLSDVLAHAQGEPRGGDIMHRIFTIIRRSLPSQLTHLMRSVSPHLTEEYAKQADSVIGKAIFSIVY